MSSTNGVADILSDTKAHGFHFNSETVRKPDLGKTYRAEIVVVDDVPLFEASFPGVAKKAINGQSVRVWSQAISRNAENGKTEEQLREANVRHLLGIEQLTVETKVFVGPNDETFATKEQAQAAWLEFASK
jgi:hypothetical protein